MLGLIPLALLGGDGSDPVPERPEDKHGWTHGDQWEGDLCMHKPGLQCTEIRGTNKFDLHNDRYTSGAVLVDLANYLREDISATPLQGDLYGASATYEIALDDGAYTRPREFQQELEDVPGVGVPTDGQKYRVRCGHQEWAKRLELCTLHIREAPFNLLPAEINETVALGNFPMPESFKLRAHKLGDDHNDDHSHDLEDPVSFYSHSLNTLFVLFPIANASSTRAIEVVRLPVLKEDSKHWDGRMESLNDDMGRNFSLCKTKEACETGSPYRHMTSAVFTLEQLGGSYLAEEQPRILLYDDLQIVGLESVNFDPDKDGPLHTECCGVDGRIVPNCLNRAYFRYGATCKDYGHPEAEGDPECTQAGTMGLLPLPNIGSLNTLVDARFAPAMIYTCSSDGKGGINVTASNIANVPDPYCAPLDGHVPPDCEIFDYKPSFRLFHLPGPNISLDPFVNETPRGVTVWSIVLIVIFGILVLAVAVVLPVWWFLNQKKHKYQTVA